jgi:protein SCO1/2
MYRAVTVLALMWVGAGAAAPHAPGGAPDEKQALALSQAALGRALGDYTFHDADNRVVRLTELRGKPLVVSLIYTSCYHTCPALTQHLARHVGIAREALGQAAFNVITVGFDAPVDTPSRMRAYRRERGIAAPHWKFLSADPATIEALTRDLGFVYLRSPKGFDHTAQVTIVDADGKIYRQVYGETFDPPAFVEPLKELTFGTRANATSVSGWIEGLKLFCTVYDPASGRYRFDYSILVTLFAGIVSLGAVAVFIVRAWRHSARARA